jgi:hypothetical protein
MSNKGKPREQLLKVQIQPKKQQHESKDEDSTKKEHIVSIRRYRVL